MKNLTILFSLFLFSFLYCTKFSDSNPVDPDNVGDYSFTILWDNLTAHDTLELFRPYTIPFAETGEDGFSSFSLVDSAGAACVYVDLLNGGMTDTTAILYFTRSYSGALAFRGVRPNGKRVDSLCPVRVSVINPYQVSIDSLWGIGDQVTGSVVKSFNNLYADSSLLAFWSIGDNVIDTLAWYVPFTKTFALGGGYTIAVTLHDTLDNAIALSHVSISVTGHSPVVDSAWFAEQPCLGDTVTFTATVTDADNDSLSFTAYINDTAALITLPEFYSYTSLISVSCQAQVRDTGVALFSLQAMDRSGLSSQIYRFTDTIGYTLPLPIFPESIKVVPAGRSVTLSFDDEHYREGTVYQWHSKSLALDTLTTANSMSVMYSDTLADTVTVYGTDVFGYSGASVPLVVIPRNFSFSLEPVLWSDTLQARRWATYTVQVIAGYRGTDYYWSTTPADIVDSIIPLGDTCKIQVQDSIPPFTLSVYAVIDSSDTTNTVSGIIRTTLNRPVCLFSQASYASKIGEMVRCTLSASDANGAIAGLFMKVTQSGDTFALGTDPVFDTVFWNPDTVAAYCWAVDNDGFFSDVDSARILITSDKPYFDPLTDDTTVFINDPVRLCVTAYPGNSGAVISGYFWDTDGDGIYDDTTDTNFIILQFASAGNKTVYTGCINSFGDTAVERFTWHITVDPGTPQISSVGVENDSVYINDSITFTIHAYDNGAIVKYEYSLDSASFTDLGQDSVYSLTFADSGTHAVYTRVTDDESNLSAVHKTSMYIKYGAPVLDSVSLDTVWVNDNNGYTFYFHDVNDSVESITVNFGDGSGDSTVSGLSGTSVSIAHAYPVTKDTGYTINASVKDNDGIAASKDFAVFVLSGAPVFDSLTPDTVWVRDNNDFTVFARDTNGTLDSFRVSFNNGTTWIGSAVCTISHAFDTGDAGLKDVFVQAMDDDGQWAKDTVQVTVRLGRPVLRGDSDDTTWVIVDSGSGRNYSLHINSLDTNGTIGRYYWHEEAAFDTTSGSCVKTDDSTRTRLIDQSNMHYALKSWIYGRDDDGLLGGKQFIVYADSIPPAPTVTHQVSHPNVMISWSGMDAKDSAETQYKILCDKSNPPQAVISDFKAGKEYDSGAPLNDFNFTWTPNGGTGKYYYQVIAKDARESENRSTVSNFDY